MSLSLRKRLIKRPSYTNLRKSSKDDKSDESESPFAASPLTIDKENFATTPPPPAEKISLPRQPELARTSPSKSLLERYKGRSPAAKGPAVTTSSSKLPRPPSRRATAFTEDFTNDDLSPVSPTSQAMPFMPATTSTETAIRTAGGLEFDMLDKSTGAQTQGRGRSTEPACSGPGKNDLADNDGLQFRRATRSQTRRQERADSHTAVMEPTVKTKDFAVPTAPKRPAPAVPKHATYVRSQDVLEVARALSIRKVGGVDDLSCPLSVRKVSGDDVEPAEEPKVPSTPEASTTTPATSPDRMRPVGAEKTPMYDPHHDSDDLITHPPSRARSPDILFDALDSPSISSASSDSNSEVLEEICFTPSPRASVRVLPPLYNSQQLPGLQWISTLGASSRPGEPWGWTKRWTCCKCTAITIVEQEICAKLMCGHERCGSLCKIIMTDV